ncbi:hypothetical protein KAR91_18960 [Candidatus Pacearchaeota archaeon]|nr:hypothetical protein [Candidatus Pacearchaeota archaeon]
MLRKISAEHRETEGDIGFYIYISVDGKAFLSDAFMSTVDFHEIDLGDDICLMYRDGSMLLLENVCGLIPFAWQFDVRAHRVITRFELAVLEATHDK